MTRGYTVWGGGSVYIALGTIHSMNGGVEHVIYEREEIFIALLQVVIPFS